jgi:A/G-specific adenine glycosylase
MRILPESNDSTPSSRDVVARTLVNDLFAAATIDYNSQVVGTITHIFTHLKLTMYIHQYSFDDTSMLPERVMASTTTLKNRWIAEKDIENENLWTGMRRSWELYNKPK